MRKNTITPGGMGAITQSDKSPSRKFQAGGASFGRKLRESMLSPIMLADNRRAE